jgi:hypothetical protein
VRLPNGLRAFGGNLEVQRRFSHLVGPWLVHLWDTFMET